MHSRWVTVDGTPVHVRAWGDGSRPAIVFVHGLVVASDAIVPTAERLAPWFDVYAPDLPGFGRSAATETLSIAQLARAVQGCIESLKLERVTVVGHSFGCQVVAHFMRDRPARVAAVVLQAPSVDAAARTLHQQIRRIRVNSARERATALEAISRRDYRRAGFARCWGTLRQSLEDAIEDNVATIDAPALVVCGGRDPVVPARWARRLVDLLPQGELLVIPDATHSVPFTQPEAFAAAISGFIASHCGNRARSALSRSA
ncbi:MAG: alpha/beta hydrolase [Candidatus Eremiobacteraeota bacterium]|nr:alpha/beta hydrolase [Candidatus Eremiobacteraeota bacterium]MBC5803901.1 alpha/beta hydrolase [Candidatus Eremiobacteraeota bacterium]